MSRLYSALLIGALCATSFVVGVRTQQGPSCPQEDSCSIDYRDGAWHITEVTP